MFSAVLLSHSMKFGLYFWKTMREPEENQIKGHFNYNAVFLKKIFGGHR